MKAKRLLFAGLVGLVGFLGAQDMVKNPEKPASPNAGPDPGPPRGAQDHGRRWRVFPPISIHCEDGSGRSYLPARHRDEIIQMDARGHFLRNLYKKGQGPGELNYGSEFRAGRPLLLVHSNDPGKLVWFDAQGKAVKEVSLAAAGGRMDYLFRGDGRILFLQTGCSGRGWEGRPATSRILS